MLFKNAIFVGGNMHIYPMQKWDKAVPSKNHFMLCHFCWQLQKAPTVDNERLYRHRQ